MLYSLVGQLPKHRYVWVEPKFVLKEPTSDALLPAVWFGLVSYPARAWGCTVMLESGAVYRNLPPHSLSFSPDRSGLADSWDIQDSQTWDCYGSQFTTLEYDYLSELECLVLANGQKYKGEYLFTVAPVGDGFSAYPEQAKEFTFVRLVNGRLTIQPTNHIIFREKSFTSDKIEFPSGIRRQLETYHCE